MHPMFVTLFIETDADELLARSRTGSAARTPPGAADQPGS